MFFDKKSKNLLKCPNCESKIEKKFSFCPYCGEDMIDREKETRDFGMLGKSDMQNKANPMADMNLGLMDKMLGTMVASLVKSLDKQFKEMDKADVKSFPNGISIRIGPAANANVSQANQQKARVVKRQLTEQQMAKLVELPKIPAKSSIKRLSDRVICELEASGIRSPEDIILSKLESGYEIKAITSDKVYSNTIPVNLPLKGITINKDNLLIEFMPGNR